MSPLRLPVALWRSIRRGIRALIARSETDSDISEEVQDFLERAAAANLARGMSPDAARRAARLEVGNVTAVEEQMRSFGWENAVDVFVTDVRHAARRLRRDLTFTVATVVTLALGIGASTTIFSAVRPVLIEPLPYPDARRIASIADIGTNGARVDVTYGTYRELAERSRSFTAIAAFRPWQPVLTGTDDPERLEGQRVGASYFRVLGVAPALGRDFLTDEDQPGGANVAVISDALWRRRFGSDSAVLGERVVLDGASVMIVGVMPRKFENVLAPSADVWSTLQYDMSQGRAWGHHLQMVARTRSGVSVDAAARELDGIARTLLAEFPRPPHASMANGLAVGSLQADITGDVKPLLFAVVGAVALVLLIACVNVTNLMLARAAQRQGEFATRLALGAARGRLVRQSFTESLLLVPAGAGLGTVLAILGVRALVALSPPGMPRVDAIAVNGDVLTFTVLLSVAVSLVVGIAPALQVSRVNLHARMLDASRRSVGNRQLTRRALVVAEVALALVLLVGTGLLLKSMDRLFAITPGFDRENVLTMQVQAIGRQFDDSSAHLFFEQALDAVRQVPGVTMAAFTSQLPLSGDADAFGVTPAQTGDATVMGSSAFRYAVSRDYFATMRIPLVRGRLLDDRDVKSADRSLVVNAAFAERQYRGQNPLGQRVHVGRTDVEPFTIVGVVGDVKQSSLVAEQSDAVYMTSEQWPTADLSRWLVVRATMNPASLVPAIKRAIWSVDKDQPIERVASLDAVVAATAADRRFALIVFEVFGLVALLLTATGIYGVLSGSVAERTREIGVRTALGASRTNTLSLVIRQGMLLAVVGVAIGLGAAMATTNALVTLLFGTSRFDAITYASAAAVVVSVSIAAAWLPARRAALVDPNTALRHD